MSSHKTRIIERLRREFPGKWHWNKNWAYWCHEDGWYVYATSVAAPRFDGDDDTFVTQYIRSGSGQRVLD